MLAGAGGVRNEGIISAPDGQVVLAAGQGVDLVDGQTRHIAVHVQAPQGEAVNLGSVAVGGGRVDLVAAMVNQQGIVRAESWAAPAAPSSCRVARACRRRPAASPARTAPAAAQCRWTGGSGGTMLAGAITATGSAGAGGDATLLGRQVGLLGGSTVDVSGSSGGGRVRAGGGAQGQDSSVVNAQALYMAPDASVRADATGMGDGGHIVLWSNEATRAYGTLSARGGGGGR